MDEGLHRMVARDGHPPVNYLQLFIPGDNIFMSTTLAEPTTRPNTSPAQRLRTTMAAVRLSFVWFGTRKTLTAEQRAQAADTFGAEQSFLSAGKKLLDTSHSAFKTVTGVRGRLVQFWKGLTLPYPEPGIRLIRQDDISIFDVQMITLKAELDDAVCRLDEHYAELRSAARNRLGRLFNSADYPESLRGLFAVSWDFPSVEPPDYLRQLSPALYEQERERAMARFEQAVQLAEEAFTSELAKLVSHLTERLAGQSDGKAKTFRDSSVENLREFFERFRSLNVCSSQQLDALVEQAQRVVSGIDPQQLRKSESLREHVASQLVTVQATLDGLMVDRPRRNIIRRKTEVA